MRLMLESMLPSPCQAESSRAILLWLGSGELDHLGPLRGFFENKLPEVGGRAREHCRSQVGKPRLDCRVGEAGIDLPVEPVDNLGRRVLGPPAAIPRGCLVARHELAPRRE